MSSTPPPYVPPEPGPAVPPPFDPGTMGAPDAPPDPSVAPVAGESEAPVRRRRGRSKMTPSQKALLTAMIAGAGLIGALSPGEATGQPVVDALYRAAFVAAVSLAASRARRWSLILGSAISVVSSVGLGLLFCGAALLMMVVLVLRNVRNRAYGACVGAFIGMACLRFDIGGFLGAPSLVAAAVVLPIMWSGYRVSRPQARRNVRIVIASFAVLMVVGIGLAVYQALTYSSTLQDAVTSTTDGINLVRDGNTVEAAKKFESSTSGFRSVVDDASAWWLFPARMVPIVGQNVEVIPVMAEAGANLTEAAGTTASEVDYNQIRREGGGVDLALLEKFKEPVLEVDRRLRAASADVDRIRSPWMVQPLAERVEEFDDKVDDLANETAIASLALRHGPALFGGEGERHYLVLLGNPAEARDLGGHIGNFAELSFVDGAVSLVRVGRPLEISQPKLDDAVAESGDVPPSMLSLRPATFPQNWGASMDFPTDAEVAARLYQNVAGHPIDGVMYADPYALAAMLGITGPVAVPGIDRELSSADAVKFLTLDQFSAFPDQNVGDTALTEFVRTLFDRLTTTTLPSPADLGEQFGPLVKQGRFRFYSVRDQDRPLIDGLGLGVGFRPTSGQDLLGVSTRNTNPSKIDAFVHRTTDAQVTWNPDDGSVTSTITVTLRNDAPATGLPAYVIGNSLGAPNGTNVTDVAVITPFEASSATVDGAAARISPLRDGDVWRHTVRVQVPPGGTVTVVVELQGDVDPGDSYDLRFNGQPLVNPGPVTLKVTTATGDPIREGPGIKVSDASATATLTDIGQTLLSLELGK